VILDEVVEGAMREQLQSMHPSLGILVVAYDPTPAYGMLLVAAGVACVAFSVSAVDLAVVVRMTARGEWLFVPRERSYPRDAQPLSRRERQVFVRLSKGDSYHGIACELGIGVRTVETYASSARRKLGVRNSRELLGMPVPLAWRGTD
jgi:DNA-binding NarL/FixJ family response regulator